MTSLKNREKQGEPSKPDYPDYPSAKEGVETVLQGKRSITHSMNVVTLITLLETGNSVRRAFSNQGYQGNGHGNLVSGTKSSRRAFSNQGNLLYTHAHERGRGVVA